jgi:hypothetical protein
MKINWHILSHSVHFVVLALGVFAILSFLATLHAFYFVLAALFLGGFVLALYKLELAVRETRLRKGWYL